MNGDNVMITLALMGFDLPAFDEWLDSLEDCPARRELQHRRDNLVERVTSGKVIKYNAADDDSQPAIKRELEFLTSRRREIQRDDVLLPMARRDHKRQEGTKKPRRPEIDEWIKHRLQRDPDVKSPKLWHTAPEWITDQIGFDRFCKRVTKARKKAIAP